MKSRVDRLRRWFEHTFVIAGVDPTYGLVYKRWFIWYAWSIGVRLHPPSRYRIEPTMSIPAAIWSNVWGNLRDYVSSLRRAYSRRVKA